MNPHRTSNSLRIASLNKLNKSIEKTCICFYTRPCYTHVFVIVNQINSLKMAQKVALSEGGNHYSAIIILDPLTVTRNDC